MIVIWGLGGLLVLAFGAVLLVGAPYMPTLAKGRKQALDLLGLQPGQTLYELGSGDGGLLKDAAQRGLKVVGYELNIFLVITSRLRTWRYRKQVKIVWGNFWTADLSKADGVFVFLLDRFMPALDAKIKKEGKGLKLVSHAFPVPGKKTARTSGAMLLYIYQPIAKGR